MTHLSVEPHPSLDLAAFACRLPRPLEAVESPAWLRALLALEAEAPFAREEAVRTAVRDLLRLGGYKPTGRGKPASEYLAGAAAAGRLDSINALVDACNAVSLHAGLPISLVDLDRARAPLRVALAQPGSRYVFNRAGQEIDLSGLLCLHDTDGPCANGVKDAQRTKTSPETVRALALIWGTRALPGRAAAAERWYRALLERLGAACEEVPRAPEADQDAGSSSSLNER